MSREKLIRVALRYQGLYLDVNRKDVNMESATNENVIAFVRPGRESYVAVVNLLAAPVSVALEGVPAAQPVLETGAERGEGAVSLAGWGYYVGKF